MVFGARLEDRLTKTDRKNFASFGEFTLVRKLVIGKHVKDVTFRTIEDSSDLCAAEDLLNDRYGWRGYGSTHNIPCGIHHTTFTAEVDNNVVGTITLAIDSEHGLAIDHTFRDEVAQIRRAEEAQICELTRLAFDSSVRSKEVMAGLFHLAFIYGTAISDCTDLFIEVAPRHVCFYETMLRFERVGSLKTNESVGSPSQLMRLKVDAIRQSITEMAGSANLVSNRSLYSYFFPPLQETQIRCLLSANHKTDHVGHNSLYFERTYAELEGEAASFTSPRESFGSRDLVDTREVERTTNEEVRQAA